MSWQTFVFVPLALAVFGYASYRFWILYRLMAAHKGEDSRWGEVPTRIKTTLYNVFGQAAVLRDRRAGLMHATIFWGFLIITVGTLEQFASTVYAPLTFEFIGELPYRILVFLHDFFTFAVCLAVLYALYRRLVIRPPHLELSKDAIYILYFTGGLMLSIFLMHGFHFLGEDVWFQSAMPFSSAVAGALAVLGLEPEVYATLGVGFKWVHMLLVMGFAVYIPNSKHLHIVAAGPNTFFRSLGSSSGREKPMKTMNFEDESLEQYGASKVSELSWKDALDYYSCTECGRCEALCPAWNTEKPLSPKKLIRDLKMNLYTNREPILKGEGEVSHVIDDQVTEDVIWACTTCRACEVACPVFIEQTPKIYDIRRNLVMMESRFPAEVQTVFKNMETNATPWAFSSADRAAWAEGMDVPLMADVSGGGSEIDVLLWVGCAGSYDDRNKKVLRAFSNVLKKAGVRFAILGTEEQCTGDPARRIGNEYLYQTLAQANVETLNRYSVTRIVTACPHCFNTLKNEYSDFGGKYEVFHHSEYLARLIAEGKISPARSVGGAGPGGEIGKVTFHDSCYIGRWNGIYDEPRKVLGAVSGDAGEVVEMKSCGDQSMCCGAGGGRMFMEETIGKRVNIARTEQALETGASVVASSCPFCMTMMTDGVKSKGKQDQVRVADLAELVDEAT